MSIQLIDEYLIFQVMEHPIWKQIQVDGQSKSSGKSFPKCYAPLDSQNFVQLQEYLATNAQSVIEQINKEGAIFFRGFDVKSGEEFSSILSKLGLQSFEYIGGAAVRKLVVGSSIRKTNSIQVFTTNQAPPSQPIPFHNELLQNQKYPDYISFFCHGEPDKGGRTPLVNCTQLYSYIEKNHLQFLNKLCELGVRYCRIVSKNDNPKSPIGRGWSNIFKVETKEEAEKKIPEGGYEFEWLNNEEEDCKLTSKRLEAVTVSFSGQKTFCNQMIAVFQGWIDEKNSPASCLKFGDHSEIPQDILADIASFADKIKASVDWKVGDFVIIDNRMAMHARQPFSGYGRKIYASLLTGKADAKKGIHFTLHSGDQLPAIGLGTWKLPNQMAERIVYEAIKAGYRTIDCAACYGNEVEVGRGINRALSENIVKREDLWVTSKLWNTFHRKEHVKPAIERTLKDLGLDYLDLYLVHWPIPLKYVDPSIAYPTGFEYHPISDKGLEIIEDQVPLIQTWREMENLYREGLARNIGVSNFTVSILRDLNYVAEIMPSVNQVELHPELTQKNLVRFCREKGIHVTSYSTMGGTGYVQMNLATSDQLVKDHQVIAKIAEKHKKTNPQVLFRWAIQQGLSIIPKTSKAERLPENLSANEWTLNKQDMQAIDSLNQNKRYCDSASFCQEFFGQEVPNFD